MASLSNREVGVRIRKIRESRNMTLQFVAHQLGMTKSNYSKYERGEIKKIDRELLIKLSKVFLCDVGELNGFADNQDDTYDYNDDQRWLMDASKDPKVSKKLREIWKAVHGDEQNHF